MEKTPTPKKIKLLSFWRRNDGFGLIEAAITLPIFLLLLFGIVDFGNMYIQKQRISNVAENMADILRTRENVTAGTQNQFAADFWSASMPNAVSKCTVWEGFDRAPTQAQIQSKCATATGGGFYDFDRSDRLAIANPWYLVVAASAQVDYITPLPNLLGIGSTKRLQSAVVVVLGDDLLPDCDTDEVLISNGPGLGYRCGTSGISVDINQCQNVPATESCTDAPRGASWVSTGTTITAVDSAMTAVASSSYTNDVGQLLDGDSHGIEPCPAGSYADSTVFDGGIAQSIDFTKAQSGILQDSNGKNLGYYVQAKTRCSVPIITTTVTYTNRCCPLILTAPTP